MAKMEVEEFVVRAVNKLAKTGKSKGIHCVYSGFNKAFKTYFGVESSQYTNRLHEQGKIVVRPCKGGVMIYLPGDAPVPKESALDKILGD